MNLTVAVRAVLVQVAPRDIFQPRNTFKPFEYPEVVPYKEAINHSYWLVSEWNFLSDIHDFHTNLSDEERELIRRTLLAISQVEVAVKRFWTNLGNLFPKAEFEQVGVSFGESEIRHADAYSHLLEVLNLNDDFEKLLRVPAIAGRVEYLTRDRTTDKTPRDHILSLALFSLFVENVSLFGQFVIIKSFNKYKNVLKDIDNVVQATQKEEQIHALLGVQIINLVRAEHPDWFDEEFYERIYKACRKALKAESWILEWIFEAGDLDFLSRRDVEEYIKSRFNEGLEMIGGEPIYEVDPSVIKRLQWFEDEILSDVNTDFFNKKPTSYSKKTQSITAGDLF